MCQSVIPVRRSRLLDEARGSSPNIISGDSQRSKNTQTQHISIQYHDILVKTSYYSLSAMY
jgi:hypothetical protein